MSDIYERKIGNKFFKLYDFSGFPVDGWFLVRKNGRTNIDGGEQLLSFKQLSLNQLKYRVYINDISTILSQKGSLEKIKNFLTNPPKYQDYTLEEKESYDIYRHRINGRRKRIGVNFTAFTKTGLYYVSSGTENKADRFCSLEDITGNPLQVNITDEEFNEITTMDRASAFTKAGILLGKLAKNAE